MAGNSLGGTLALEAARIGLARRVVAISPAGLWKTHDSLHVKYVFGGLRFLAVHVPGLMKATLRRPWLREIALAVPISVGSRRMPVDDALRAVDDLAVSDRVRVHVHQHPGAVFRRGRVGARHRRVWRPRLDPAATLTASERTAGHDPLGQEARLGSRADVDRSSWCRGGDSGGHPAGSSIIGCLARPKHGPVAQLGARMNGIHEVTGSIPVWSTILRSPAFVSERRSASQPSITVSNVVGRVAAVVVTGCATARVSQSQISAIVVYEKGARLTSRGRLTP